MNIILLLIKLLISSSESHHLIQKCWSKDDVDVGRHQNFSYQFIFANEHDAVEMQCKECIGSDPHDVNIFWTKVKLTLNQTDESHSLNKQQKSLEKGIKILDNLSLFIKKVQPKHSGLYNCYLNSSSSDFQSGLTSPFEAFSYFLHVSDRKNRSLNGTYTEWNYYEDYVYRSAERILQSIPNATQQFKPTLIVHWTAWGNCLCGKYTYDTRSYRYAFCCIQLSDGLILPCQSTTLKEIRRDVAKTVENISKFKEYRRCMDDCIPAVEEDQVDFKFQKTYYLRQSSHLELECLEPNNSVAGNSTEFLWIRDESTLLNKSKNALGKSVKELRVAVDSFNTLYLNDVSKDEEGYYSCFDNGVPIVKYLIRIEPNNLIFTKDCGQKLLILTCVIVLWTVVYLILEYIKFGMNAKSEK